MGYISEEQYIAHRRNRRPDPIDGYIKLKLIHGKDRSLLVPDLLAADLGGMLWFQPKFFYASRVCFMDGFAVADIRMDLCSGAPVCATITSGGFVASLGDSSQVFRCLISDSGSLASEADGTCSLLADGDFLLDLFHHTTSEAVEAINASGHFRGSRWNVQGTRELTNVEYAYFASLPRISSERDLAKIAMTSAERTCLRMSNADSEQDVTCIEVHRQSTPDRTATMSVSVPSSLIASQRVFRRTTRHNAVHYEVCNPNIYRVGLQPGKVAPFHDGILEVPRVDTKHFDCLVLADTDAAKGLSPSHDPEETESLLHLENFGEHTFFEFWRSHASSDVMLGVPPTCGDLGGPTAPKRMLAESARGQVNASPPTWVPPESSAAPQLQSATPSAAA